MSDERKRIFTVPFIMVLVSFVIIIFVSITSITRIPDNYVGVVQKDTMEKVSVTVLTPGIHFKLFQHLTSETHYVDLGPHIYVFGEGWDPAKQ